MDRSSIITKGSFEEAVNRIELGYEIIIKNHHIPFKRKATRFLSELREDLYFLKKIEEERTIYQNRRNIISKHIRNVKSLWGNPHIYFDECLDGPWLYCLEHKNLNLN